jgi:glutamine synthetase
MREPLTVALTHDIAGKTRGKAFPTAQLAKRIQRGVGWTPTNVQITCFDAIAESPFGALGDLALIPDPEAKVFVDYADGSAPESFVIGDIRSLEGEPWSCCTRSILKGALARLERLAGVTILGAFEHEFQLRGPSPGQGWAYSMAGFRHQALFCETLMAAMKAGGLKPDTVMKEYGDNQYEVTIMPDQGVRVADASTILRELVNATAIRAGESATFTPIRDPAGVGNGVHVHLSFLDADGLPATYDADRPHGMSALTGAFIAGVLKYLDRIVAITAPSVISYTRLTPHRWSAAFNNLGYRDREASVRICPVSLTAGESVARQYNFEYRAADATSSPHLTLAAIVHAGCQGIEEKLAPPAATTEDLSLLTPGELAARGYLRLPTTLAEALDRFGGDAIVTGWFPEGFAEIYVAHKKGEMKYLQGLTEAEVFAIYEAVY